MNYSSYVPFYYYDSYFDSYVGAQSTSSSLVSTSTLAKAALVVGGALAIYLIFQVSKSAEKLEPLHRGVGRMAGKVAKARYGGKASALLGSGVDGRDATTMRLKNSSDSLLGGTDSYKLLTA